MEGRKDDQEKPEIGLIPNLYLAGMAKVLMFGKSRYGAYNWTKGMAWSRLVNAAYRHLGSFNDNIDNDEESGFSHLLHASCCLMFLYTYKQLGLGVDDRHKWEYNGKHGDEETNREVPTEQTKRVESNHIKKREIQAEDSSVIYYTCGCIGTKKSDDRDLVGCKLHYPDLVDEDN